MVNDRLLQPVVRHSVFLRHRVNNRRSQLSVLCSPVVRRSRLQSALLPTVSGLLTRSVGGNQPVTVPGVRSADVTAAVGLETPVPAPVGLAMAVDTSGTSAVVLHADGNEGGASEKNAESEDVPGGSVRPKTSKRRPKN